MVHDVIVLQGSGLNAVVREHGDIAGRSAEQKVVVFFVGGDIGGVGQGPLKVDNRQIVRQQDVPDVLHGEVDIPVVLFQLIVEDVGLLPAIPADGEIAGGGQGDQDGAVMLLIGGLELLLRGLRWLGGDNNGVRHDIGIGILQDVKEQQLVLLRQGRAGTQQKNQDQGEQLLHNSSFTKTAIRSRAMFSLSTAVA